MVRMERDESLQHRDGEHPAEHLHRVTNGSNEFMARMNTNSRIGGDPPIGIARQAHRAAYRGARAQWLKDHARQELAPIDTEGKTTNSRDECAASVCVRLSA
jgi:hypothetical protein